MPPVLDTSAGVLQLGVAGIAMSPNTTLASTSSAGTGLVPELVTSNEYVTCVPAGTRSSLTDLTNVIPGSITRTCSVSWDAYTLPSGSIPSTDAELTSKMSGAAGIGTGRVQV